MTPAPPRCTGKEGVALPWAAQVPCADAIRQGMAAAEAYKKSVGVDDANAFFASEIAQAKEVGWQMIRDQHLDASRGPIPIVWIPDGGVLQQEGLKQAFDEAGIPVLSVPCDGAERRHRHLAPREARMAAEKCGHVILADGVIKTGESMIALLNSLYQFKGKFLLAANRVYRDEALDEKRGFRTVMEGRNLVPHQAPKDVTLYAANVCERTQDLLDIGDLVAAERDRPGSLVAGMPLVKRRPERGKECPGLP